MSDNLGQTETRINVIAVVIESYTALIRFFPSIVLLFLQAAVFAIAYWFVVFLLLSDATLDQLLTVLRSFEPTEMMPILSGLVEKIGFRLYAALVLIVFFIAIAIPGAPLSRRIILGERIGFLSAFRMSTIWFAVTAFWVGLVVVLCFSIIGFVVILPLSVMIGNPNVNLSSQVGSMSVLVLVAEFLLLWATARIILSPAAYAVKERDNWFSGKDVSQGHTLQIALSLLLFFVSWSLLSYALLFVAYKVAGLTFPLAAIFSFFGESQVASDAMADLLAQATEKPIWLMAVEQIVNALGLIAPVVPLAVIYRKLA